MGRRKTRRGRSKRQVQEGREKERGVRSNTGKEEREQKHPEYLYLGQTRTAG